MAGFMHYGTRLGTGQTKAVQCNAHPGLNTFKNLSSLNYHAILCHYHFLICCVLIILIADQEPM